ncbi:MAG: hypothetical protein AAB909_04435 [Patescibacteria group bacterium]
MKIIASLLIASALSAILSPRLSSFASSLYSSDIPGVSQSLIQAKSYDLTEFALTFILSIIIVGANEYFLKKDPGYFLLTLGVLSFLYTRFATYSGKAVIGVIVVCELILIISSRFINKKTADDPLAIFNGLFMGFYFLIFLNLVTPLVSISISALVLVPVLNLVLSRHFPKWSNIVQYFPTPLVALAAIFPKNNLVIFSLGALIILVWIVCVNLKKTILPQKVLLNYLLPILLIFLVSYNPGYNIGDFDSVEEGFWSAWVQRLTQGEMLYKDVFVYHPPVLIWGLYLFEKIAGFTLSSQRLFMHLLQVMGAVIFMFFARNLIKSKWLLVIIVLCFLGLTTSSVKNNVEIRVAFGLASLLALSSRKYALSGALTAVTFFTSIEVGLASVISHLLFIFLQNARLKNLSRWALGIFLGASPVVIVLLITGGLWGFISQITFYASIFSKGYFNAPVDRAISLSFFHWHIFNQYLSSPAMWFEISKFVIFGSVIISFYKKNHYLLAVSTFALVLYRVALGRSDFLHLLFPLIVVLVIIGHALDSLTKDKLLLAVVLSVILVTMGARDAISSAYLENMIMRLQTYGAPTGEYYAYSSPRGGGLQKGTRVTTESENELLEFIETNTTPADSLFAYPWYPEIYFLTNRSNPTPVDTPYAFYTSDHQKIMIEGLNKSQPKYIIYNPDMNFGGLSVGALPEVDEYIKSNYTPEKQFGKNRVYVKR